ncbi:hypothetical protein C8R45DRAFT_140135 [Mycena sanguinolenta]|nr:hypothetical protein C8R45DRAFT_140135 [Mycena sanguinolenta]
MSFTRALVSTSRPFAATRFAATRRTFASTATPPPPTPPPAQKSGSNTTLYLVGATLAAGAGYYYYTQNPEKVNTAAHKAKAEEEAAVKHAKEMGNNAMAAGQDRLAAARTTVSGSLKDARDASNRVVADADARAHKVASDAEAQYDSAKASLQKGTEKKADEAKAGWFSWLGWGSKKVDEGKEKLEDGKDKAKKEGAKAAGDVQKKLDS